MNNTFYCKSNQIYDYQLTNKKAKLDNKTTDVWGISLYTKNKHTFDIDDVSTSRELVVLLIDVLSKNAVEPKQAEYVIEDFIAKTHTFDIM